jgi:hypothetical protein
MMYAPADKDRCASPPSRAVRLVANIFSEPFGMIRLKVWLALVTHINTMVTFELFQFQLLAANPFIFRTNRPHVYI